MTFKSRRFSHSPLLSLALGLPLVTTIAALSGSCGSGADGTPPCESVYAGKCGTTCFTDTSCPAGLYCGLSGTCTADCAKDAAQCGSGMVCDPHGRCVPPGGGAGG